MVKKKGNQTKSHGGLKIFLIIFIIIIVLGIAGAFYFYGSDKSTGSRGTVLENPVMKIAEANRNAQGRIDQVAVLAQGVLDFDDRYINYLLISMGVGKLNSAIGFGDPSVQFVLDGETWNSKLKNNLLSSNEGVSEDPDLIIRMSKEEAVRALLSNDVGAFLQKSVKEGNTQIELAAGKVELFSKGYLKLYKDLTGKEANIEE